jgi:ABC-type sugar transport system permease subunit
MDNRKGRVACISLGLFLLACLIYESGPAKIVSDLAAVGGGLIVIVALEFVVDDETGLVNGGSRLHVMFRVVLPQVRPGLIAALIFNLIFVWNEFLFNFIIGGKRTTMIPVSLVTGSLAQGGVDWTFVASLASVYLVPPVLAIYFFQKYLLVGMTFGTVRGEV